MGLGNRFLDSSCKIGSKFPSKKIDLTNVEAWLPFTKLFCAFGQFPLVVEDETTPTRFTFRVISAGTCFVIIWVIIRLAAWVSEFYLQARSSFTLCGSVLNVTFKGSTPTIAEKLMNPFPMYLIPVINTLEWASILITLRYFVKFLRNWGHFANSGIHTKESESTNQVNGIELAGLIKIFCISFFPMTWHSGWFAGKYFTGVLNQANCSFVTTAIVLVPLRVVAALEDARLLLMLSSVITALSKIHNSISIYTFVDENKRLTSLTIRSWAKSHAIIREQVRLIGTCKGPQEILFIVYLISLQSTTFFSALSQLFRGEPVSTLVLVENICGVVLVLFRLFVKCYYAEKVTRKENLLVQSLLSWEFSENAEVKHFADSIVWNPSKVVYCSVVPVDMNLSFKVVTLIISNIVILLQFQLSSSVFCAK